MPIGRNGLSAGISYDTNTGAMVINGADGATAVRSAAGDCDITLDRGVDITDMCLLATRRDALIGSIRYVNTSDTVKRIVTRDEAAGAFADSEAGVDCLILKVSQIDRGLVQAAGNFGGAAAGAAVANAQRGAVVVRTGVGVYTITLDKPMDQRECAVLVTVGVGAGAAVNLHPRVVHTSDAVKTVTIETLVAGADVDADFSWAVFSQMHAPDSRVASIGSIDAAGGNPVGRGCLPARNGAGDYRYAIDRALGAAGYLALATVIGATGASIRTTDAAVGRKDVETQVQAAAAQTDTDNALVVVRLQ